MKKLKELEKSAMKPSNMHFDPRSDPKYWGYAWTNWKDFEDFKFSQFSEL